MYPSPENESFGTFVRNFHTGMSELGYDITKKVIIKKSQKKEGNIKLILKYLKFYISVWLEIFRNKNDITYIHYVSHCSIPVLFSKKKNILISNVHGTDVLPTTRKQKFFNLFVLKVLKKSDLVVVPSEYYRDFIEKKYQIDPNKIYISPSGGINPNTFKKTNYKKNTTMNFGFVSRIEKGKGWDTFIRAVNELKDKNFDFTIIGSGSKEHQMLQLINKYGLEDNISVLPSQPQSELVDYFNSFSSFIFPSEFESLGLVGIEAMACGVPVIGANNEGILTYLKDGKNGLVFEVNNHKELATKIIEFSEFNELKLDKLSKEATETSRKYHQEVISRKLDIRIRDLVNSVN